MNFFDEAALRLKQQLKVTEDKAAAEALGMSARAWAGRKERGSFPEKELRALAQQCPDLGIDVDYVLTGQSAKQAAAQMLANFGTRLREVRGERSLEEFAALMQESAEKIAAIEAQESLPTPKLVQRLIATHPEEGVMWLMGGQRVQLDSPITELEAVMLMNYRQASLEGQAALRSLAAFYGTYDQDKN